MKYFRPSLACDFIASDGLRTTCFQLCAPRPGGGFAAVATVDLLDEVLTRFDSIPALLPRMAGIIRLARAYQRRATPTSFGPLGLDAVRRANREVAVASTYEPSGLLPVIRPARKPSGEA